MEKKYFEYGEKEIAYLKSKDKMLGEVIDHIGMIQREVSDDLFSSIVNSIIGQQISTVAHKTIWKRLLDKIEVVDAKSIMQLSKDELQSVGLSFRKVEYIQDFASKVLNNEFDIEKLHTLSDQEVIDQLSSLNGIGEWTAEMMMLHCMKRSDIVSYKDLAILRGMRMVYHHRKLDKVKFKKYIKRYSPYGTVASIYFWEISTGKYPQYKDLAKKTVKKKEKK